MHAEPQAGLPALVVLVIAILVFHGSVYLVVGLNAGWRFGYWITGATMGGLMLFLAVFWLSNALGPRGEEPLWYPVESSSSSISETTFNGRTFTGPAAYPGGDWKAGDGELKPYVDAINASLSNCTAFTDTKIETAEHDIKKLDGITRTALEGKFGKKARLERELEACKQLTSMLPPSGDLPQIDGQPVAAVYDVTDLRFTEENGHTLGMAKIVPNTYDKRVTGDPEGLKPLQVGDPLYVVAYRDPGSLRYPSWIYLFGSILFFAFHLWGLNRAERRKLSPVAA